MIDHITFHDFFNQETEEGYINNRDIEICFCSWCNHAIRGLYIQMQTHKDEVNKKNHPNSHKKSPVPQILRMKAFKRDNFTCVKCGFSPENKDDCIKLHADHIHPEKHGGKASLENLQTLCRNCNSSKGSKMQHQPIDT